ncbi:hypothetical protein KIW84_055474 [Lathyrus oleraceus]|uniref:Helicase ATP-binding domain-containing protein n=1 Tax=Pisum sativum TaxID=3888 RepID=A0A9D4WYB9_PEA|nr:hypothetical protein KIW84_055474 [Pisum sativum]
MYVNQTFDEWKRVVKKPSTYTLTPGQLQAVSEIIWDLKRPVPMNRLLQGDVGCGKPIVDFLACMEAEFKPTVALLTGSTPLNQSRMIRKGIQTGEISMAIGTHSLIAESVEFSALRIAVVDEQHRFGVIQRGRFNSKLFYKSTISSMEDDAITDGSSKSDDYMAPHVLAMSATLIPKTLHSA